MVTHAGSTKHKTSRRLQKIIIITVVVKRCDRPPPATEKQRYIRQHSVTDKCKSKNMNLNSISCTVKVQHPMSKYRNVVKTPDQTTLVQLFSCVRRSLSRHALLTLVRALIVSKVDYCNSVLAGIPGQLQDRLQSVLNAAARLVYSARRSERITPLLRELHWLRVPERVTFRLCVLAYRCLHGTAPAYLAESRPAPDI